MTEPLDRDSDDASEGLPTWRDESARLRAARREEKRRHKRRMQSLALAAAAFLSLHVALWANSWQDSHRIDLAALAWAVVLTALAVYVYPRH